MGGVAAPVAVVAARAGVGAASWEEAVETAAALLVIAGAADPSYPGRCVETVSRNGPYIVVAPGVALAHARPEDGARRVGVSAVVLSSPVSFGHPANDPVDVVFAFASPDKDAHVSLLARLAEALVDGLADELRAARSDADAKALLGKAVDP